MLSFCTSPLKGGKAIYNSPPQLNDMLASYMAILLPVYSGMQYKNVSDP
jgi:hypothetical protein